MSKKKKTIKKNSKQTYMEKKTAIAGILRDRKTSPKKERKKVNLSLKQITVKNAEGDPDTTATILIQNQIDYIPKVSVIIPVYNVEQYLRECLDSVVNQTLKEIEIICVDDGSTDSSLEILKEYAQKDKRITIITQKNLYAGVARNAGLSQAKGEYVHFLDSDDWVEKEPLEQLYSLAVLNNVDVLKFKNKIYDNEKGIVLENSWINMDGFPDEYTNKILKIQDCPMLIKLPDSPWSGIYKLSYLQRNVIRFDNLICANDSSFFIEVVSKGSVYVSKKISLVMYRINNDKSLIGIRHKNFFCQLALYNNINRRIQHLSKYLISQINARTLAGIGYKINEYFSKDIDIAIKEEIFQQAKSFFVSTDISEILKLNTTSIYPIQHTLAIKKMISCSEDYIQYERNKLQPCILNRGVLDIDVRISIIIPVYNVENYIVECLDSITKQTLTEIEIICIDDGSTDNSLQILKNYSQKDKRLTILTLKNSGAAVARNSGLLLAKGEFVAFMDSDDIYPSSDILEYMYINAKKHKALICGGSLYQIKNGKLITDPKVLGSGYSFDKNGFIDYVDYQYDFGFTRFIYDRQFLKKNKIYFPKYLRFEDPVFFIKAMALAKRFYALRRATYIYRVEYKEIQWTLKKAQDVVKGITDGLTLSKQYGLVKLHYQYSKQKLWSNWLTRNVYNSLGINDPLLIKMLNAVDLELVRQIDPSYRLPSYVNIKRMPISVIIPVYNMEKYLSECLDSVLNQTLKDIEIICVNDGSTDNSMKILKDYANRDKRIIIIDQHNQGLSCSRNNAMKIAKGEYLLFLDSDDWIRNDTCELLYTKAKSNGIDMLNFAGTNYDDTTQTFTQTTSQKICYISDNKSCFSRAELETFMYNIPISACRFFYNRDFLENNKITFPEGINFEDNYFVRKALIFVERYAIEREILYFRRIHGASITQNVGKFFRDYMEVVSRVSNLYQQNHIKEEVSQRIIQLYCNFLYQQYSNFRGMERRKYRDEFFSLLRRMQREHHFNDKRFTPGYNEYKQKLESWWQEVKRTPLNLSHPKTFNEKIQWLKLYDSTPIKTRLADKYLVRDWVKEKIGEEYLIPLLGVYDRFEEIDFEKLPNQFVIKCNHGCEYNIIVKDKSQLDFQDVKSKLSSWMSENFAFKAGMELHYRDIKPKIIIEKFIENEGLNDLYDYKFWCFNGKVEYIQFLSERHLDGLKMAFYDKEWHKQKFVYSCPLDKKTIERPANLDLMIDLAEKLSMGFSYVRVDFYRLNNGRIYFGEMTFTSASGTCSWNDEDINIYFGKLIKLPKLAYNMDTKEYYKLPKFCKIKPYALFPYYLVKSLSLRKKHLILALNIIKSHLHPMRIDLKNFGAESNNLEIIANDISISTPAWFTNAQGIGKVLQGNSMTNVIRLKTINKGVLKLNFQGQDKRFNNIRYPLWIDYKSIKIDDREILSEPVATWHDKPFHYEMPVEDKQEITLRVEQQYHQYTKSELRDVLLKLKPNDLFIKENMDVIIKQLALIIGKQEEI